MISKDRRGGSRDTFGVGEAFPIFHGHNSRIDARNALPSSERLPICEFLCSDIFALRSVPIKSRGDSSRDVIESVNPVAKARDRVYPG